METVFVSMFIICCVIGGPANVNMKGSNPSNWFGYPLKAKRQDIEEPLGLHNAGGNCWANCLLQILFYNARWIANLEKSATECEKVTEELRPLKEIEKELNALEELQKVCESERINESTDFQKNAYENVTKNEKYLEYLEIVPQSSIKKKENIQELVTKVGFKIEQLGTKNQEVSEKLYEQHRMTIEALEQFVKEREGYDKILEMYHTYEGSKKDLNKVKCTKIDSQEFRKIISKRAPGIHEDYWHHEDVSEAFPAIQYVFEFAALKTTDIYKCPADIGQEVKGIIETPDLGEEFYVSHVDKKQKVYEKKWDPENAIFSKSKEEAMITIAVSFPEKGEKPVPLISLIENFMNEKISEKEQQEHKVRTRVENISSNEATYIEKPYQRIQKKYRFVKPPKNLVFQIKRFESKREESSLEDTKGKNTVYIEGKKYIRKVRETLPDFFVPDDATKEYPSYLVEKIGTSTQEVLRAFTGTQENSAINTETQVPKAVIYNNTFTKISDKVDAPLELILEKEQHILSERATYQLKSFFIHSGSLEGGHYTCCLKDKNGKSYYCNDEQVSELSEEKMLKKAQDAYTIIYELKQS